MSSTTRREFLFGGTRLSDPDPNMTPEQVKKYYSEHFPALTNASIQQQGTSNVYEFKQSVGTKG